MRKFLLVLSLAALITIPASATYLAQQEPDTAVSFSSQAAGVAFVNYAPSNGNDEFWVRASGGGEKLLHYATLTVDGESHRLRVVPADDKHLFAAVPGKIDISARYYKIDTDLAYSLFEAKKITLTTYKANGEEKTVSIDASEVKKAFGMRYADFF